MVRMDVIQAVVGQLEISVAGTKVPPNSFLPLTEFLCYDFFSLCVHKKYRIVEERFEIVKKVIFLKPRKYLIQGR